MLFGKRRKRDLRIFSIPEDNETAGAKIPMRLLIGLLTPFVIVAIFLFIFSRNIDLKTTTLKPGLPPPTPVVVPPDPVLNSKPPEQVVALKKPDETVFIAPSLPTPRVVESEIPLPSVKKPEPVKKADEVKKPEVVKKAEAVKKPAPVKKSEVVKDTEPLTERITSVFPASATKTEAVVKPIETAGVTTSTEAIAKPVEKSPVLAAGRFAIQVGSFQNKEEADRLALKLSDRGYETYVVMANIVNKGDWYRVRVGKYDDRPKALEAAEKFSSAEQISAIIVSRNPQ